MAWLISADNHWIEPEDVWTSRVPKAMKERAPRYTIENGIITGYLDGEVHFATEEYAFANELMPDDRGDYGARQKVLERDGQWAEAVFGNWAAISLMTIEEPDFAYECCRAYNDWMAESTEGYRDRVVGHAAIPMTGDPNVAAMEVERCAAMGFRSIVIPLWPAEPYFMKKHLPIWEAVVANDMAVCMHAHTGRWFRRLLWGDVPEPQVVSSGDYPDPDDRNAWMTAGGFISFPQQGYQAYQVSGWFIGSGLLERFPTLKLVFLECGAAWMLSASEWVDDVWRTVPGANRVKGSQIEGLYAPHWPHPLKPSEYFKRQVFSTFQDEPTALKYRHQIGIDKLMWASDIPHNEGTWPRSQELTAELFADIPDDERTKLTMGNFASVFRIPLPV